MRTSAGGRTVDDKYESLRLIAATFCTSSFAGLAALLRSGRRLTLVAIVSSMLNSGLLGMILFLVGYQKYQGNPYLLVGISILAGLGGMTIIDFAIQVIEKGGLHIHIRTKDPEDNQDEPH